MQCSRSMWVCSRSSPPGKAMRRGASRREEDEVREEEEEEEEEPVEAKAIARASGSII